MSYEPLPGTDPARAIAYLRSLPEGSEISTAELAEAIDCDHRSLASHLALSKKHGLVIARVPKGVLYTMWSAGKGVPLADLSTVGDNDPIGTGRAFNAPPIVASSVFDIARGASEPEIPPGRGAQQVLKAEAAKPDATGRVVPPITASPGVGPMGAGQAADAAPTGAVRFALWSDGALEIRRTGVDHFVISREDTERLFAYLDVLRTKEVPA